uniref:Sugar phosphate transporter domain-containing protein n=1 Tax=Chromera velia CCMP2878 TaxID=1169474 RepID=A0A0G4GLB7_9ALVE|mmetsp:Transcript_33050/g.65525  ORF Transcript_33050/g.65525 Transcript_33050/m.65525 type:complete len:388 (+) Transcript_33050:207-1370(+)|eukprot:Cvel_686.t1-p1 / transcript=Cvel_686.t1 / gene=Cvel_686 / organism=Chromera_velia_CCMP2878 / gene_product=Glucose-6-phosphate/phosphate translocator 2,, putative / transcript_product=Glucose-6-phosphate/phosphate translocator 2,, putative / location=Cvel_scaffold21:87808-88968(+) / protein_length=387 / sequence_SO=supercontig / SO=protein_coding / is_pseudo=false
MAGAKGNLISATNLVTAVYIGVWWGVNGWWNTNLKKLLAAVHLPWWIGFFQLFLAFLLFFVLWVVRLVQFPRVPSYDLFFRNIVPQACCHLMVHFGIVLGTFAGSVSLTNVIKAGEPVTTCFLSAVFLESGVFSLATYLTLLPVIGGVGMASVSATMRFNWPAFVASSVSNFGSSMRAVLCKMLSRDLKKKAESLEKRQQQICDDDESPSAAETGGLLEKRQQKGFGASSSSSGIDAREVRAAGGRAKKRLSDAEVLLQSFAPGNLFGLVLAISSVTCLPFCLLFESDVLRGRLPPGQLETSEERAAFMTQLAYSSVGYFVWNYLAYMLMDRLSSVSYAVANTVKRVVTIVWAVVLGGEAVSVLSGAGTAVAIFGTLLYALAKQYCG